MLRNIFLVAVVVVVGGLGYFAYTQPEMLPSPLQAFAPKIKQGIDSSRTQISKLLDNKKISTSAVMGVTSEANKVFQEDTSEKPIHQKAIDFAQYQYCLQVVKEYKTQHPELNDASTTPSPEEKQEE